MSPVQSTTARPESDFSLQERLEGMRLVGRLTAQALDMLVEHVVPGVKTIELDQLVFEFAMDHGCIPAPLNYRGFKGSICTSINHVVCHGIPGAKRLKEGDTVNLDVTLIKDGWHGDSSRMFPVGQIARKSERLIEITYESLMRGIAVVKNGATTGDIGHAIQSYAEGQNCSVVRDFCGHGLGRVFHTKPNILHYGQAAEGSRLKTGMFFTIEPMINLGRADVKVLGDGWTAVTRDKSLSAQFEHSLAVTDDGCEIFTKSLKNLDCPPYKLA